MSHLKRWSSAFCTSDQAQQRCRTPEYQWRGRRFSAVSSCDPALTQFPLRLESGLAWTRASPLDGMNSPPPAHALGSLVQRLGDPSFLWREQVVQLVSECAFLNYWWLCNGAVQVTNMLYRKARKGSSEAVLTGKIETGQTKQSRKKEHVKKKWSPWLWKDYTVLHIYKLL